MFMKLWRKFLFWFSTTSLYYFLMMKVLPYIRFTTYYTSMKGTSYHKMYSLLRPGHIILSRDKKKLTTLLIPGEFPHASFCISKNKNWEVSEMTHHDYTKSTFPDICFQADRVVIIECEDFDPHYIAKMVEKCKSFADTKYDVQFQLGVEALFCSEMVYESDFEKRLDVSLEDIAGLGTPYISPTGLYRAKNVKVIYDTDWEKEEETEV